MTALLIVLVVGFFAAALGQTGTCPGPCPDILLPVCGTDNQTYPNSCDLRNSNCDRPDVTVAYEGQCLKCYVQDWIPPCPSRACFRIYLPVCGSDGVTYANSCEFHADNCARSPQEKVRPVYCGRCKRES
ncbi:four-domain proteases inhibitor-like [Physella acuta]|uniref:four-domain proteases inhibitor-like n=1 Tax=Physella acuta TaxID=109671 RepID=UPI0027DE204C|nr:four-domain proteases inhibitor-like [Physella acuta]